MAKALGKNEDSATLANGQKITSSYYDQSVGFFRGIKSDGTRNPEFDAFKSTKPWAEDYAEGNAWQYLWLAPQDVSGLIDFLGGKDIFNARLDSFFTLTSQRQFRSIGRSYRSYRSVCTWQRTQPPHCLFVCLFWAAMENSRESSLHHEGVLPR